MQPVMTNILRYPQRDRDETTAYIGMVLFLASWGMMFSALFFAYAYVRSNAQAWPPPGLPALPLALPGLNTGVIAVSSIVLIRAVGATRRNDWAAASRGIALTVILGGVFCGLQAALWWTMHRHGFTVQAGGSYASVFYALPSVHLAHVVVGLFGLGRQYRPTRDGLLAAKRALPVRLWGMYWHFVGIVWAVMFVSIFVM